MGLLHHEGEVVSSNFSPKKAFFPIEPDDLGFLIARIDSIDL